MRGKHETIECYRVLTIFIKYYNKRYVATDGTKFEFKREYKAVYVLARMVKKQGAAFKEIILEAGCSFGPKSMFCTRTMDEITGDESVLVDYYSSIQHKNLDIIIRKQLYLNTLLVI